MKWIKLPEKEFQKRWNNGESIESLIAVCEVSRKHLTDKIIPELITLGYLLKTRKRKYRRSMDEKELQDTRIVWGDPDRQKRIEEMILRAARELPVAVP